MQKRWCYWLVYAYNKHLTRWLVDYGAEQFTDEGEHVKEPTEKKIKDGLDEAFLTLKGYDCKYIAVDTGYTLGPKFQSVIRNWVRSRGGPLRAIVGRTTGQVKQMKETGKNLVMPAGCSFARCRVQPTGEKLFFLDVEMLKEDVHNAFFIPQGENGCVYLWHDMKKYGAYARHICAEQLVYTFVPGKGVWKEWKQKHTRNDWLDCSAYCEAFAQLHVQIMRAEEKRLARIRRGRGKNAPAPIIRDDY